MASVISLDEVLLINTVRQKMTSEKKGVFTSAQIALTGPPQVISECLSGIKKPRGFKFDIEVFPEEIGVAILVEETAHYQKFPCVLGEFLTSLFPLTSDDKVSVVQVTFQLRSDVVSAFLVPSSLSTVLSRLDSSLFISIEPANGVERCLSQDERWRTNQST